MKVLVFGLALFCLAFIIHLIVWKIRLPKRQVKTILQLFFATLFAGILALWNAPPSFNFFNLPAPENLWEYLHICLLFVSLTLVYMITYSALEADSPSFVMVMTISNSSPHGLDKKKFEQMMSDDTLVIPRIKDILLDRMVYMDGDRYRLTSKGIIMARIFICYRKLINAPKGG